MLYPATLRLDPALEFARRSVLSTIPASNRGFLSSSLPLPFFVFWLLVVFFFLSPNPPAEENPGPRSYSLEVRSPKIFFTSLSP